ncbi:MAG: carboxymuconolactone decarboxylase family protein, partial [Gammaproteobacteria bacterium]|nr:carboxymuconolactone decarboxylase family protein [Gammaproteobacteria bacterium]
MPYIKTISDDEAEGIVKKNYESSRKANGANYSTERILSLWPKVQTMENRRYQAVMLDTSELTRATKEMIGAAVSAANNCDYCVQHHVSMMVEAGVDPSTAWQVADDYTQARVDERTQALLEFALTARPDLTNQTDVDKLKALGIS